MSELGGRAMGDLAKGKLDELGGLGKVRELGELGDLGELEWAMIHGPQAVGDGR